MSDKRKDPSTISTIRYTIKTMFELDKPYALLLIVSMITMSILPFLNANIVSHVVNLMVDGYETNAIVIRIMIILAAIVVLETLDAFVLWFRSNHYISLGHTIDVIVAKKTLSMRYEYAESPQVSELRMKANRAGSSLPVSAESTVELIANMIKTLACAAVFTMVNPFILIVVAGFTIINYLFSRRLQGKIYQNEQKEYPYRRKANHFLETMLDYVSGKEIRAFSASKLIKEKYADAETGVYQVQKDTQKIQLIDRVVGLVVVVVQQAAIYLLTGREYFAGRAAIGDVILYVNLIFVFSASFQGIFYKLLEINFRGRRLDDYRVYLALDEEEADRETNEIDDSSVTIEFEHVWFHYPGSEEYILKDVCFKFDNNRNYAIVGENGSGKTTLIKLMMRFYLPTRGRILVNGIDYTTIHREKYYKLFTTVFQDFNLLAFSVAENIDFSMKEQKDATGVKEVLARQGILNRVEEHPNGIDTYVSQEYSSDGVNFSGGERQKIAIARADYKQAPVFILDEPTSALDPLAEKKLYDTMNSIIDNKMMIIISHRLQSVMLCDEIIYLKYGEIVETGSHKELIRNGRNYSKMFELQAHWYE